MKHIAVPSFVLACLSAPGAFAQERSAVNSLERTRATFTAADANNDAKLSYDEIVRQKFASDRAAFDAQDADKDGAWSRDEFAVYYRQTLANAGQKPATDLENEVARILALRKAKVEDDARKRATPLKAPLGPGTARQAAREAKENDPAAIEARLQRAIDELEKKAKERGATREDFQRVRDAYEARAKLAAVPGAVPGAADGAADGAAEAKGRFERALAALEKRAAESGYDREEFVALRDGLVKRAREAQTPGEPAAGGDAQPVDLEARLQRALDDLEKKAEARNATREDFQRVREAWEARAKNAASEAPASARESAGADVAARLTRALDDLEKRTLAGEFSREQFVAMRQSMVSRARASSGAQADPATPAPIEARFEDALATLEARALARGATREDFQRVKDLLVARARASWNAQNGAPGLEPTDAQVEEIAAKLQAALARLETATQNGTVGREDFAGLRNLLVHRAREAAKGDAEAKRADAPPGPAEGRRTPPAPQPRNEPKPADAGGQRGGGTPPPPPAEPPKEDKPGRPKPGGSGRG